MVKRQKKAASKKVVSSEPAPLWKDDDDEELEVSVPAKVKKTLKIELKRANEEDDQTLAGKEYVDRLQNAFKRRHGGTPKWAQKVEESAGDEDSLLKTAAGYLAKDLKLPKTTINTSLIKNFNIGHRSTKPISIVRFHKKRPVLVTADGGGTVNLFKVSSEVNEDNFLQSVKFNKFPITCMEFAQNGLAVICSSNMQQYLMQYNMEDETVTQLKLPNTVPAQGVTLFAISRDSEVLAVAGNNNHVYILQATTMEHIKTISLPSNASQIKFFPGSKEIWVICENGQIVISSTINVTQHTFTDDGAVHGTCLALSNHGDYFATGSDTGIVNVYNTENCRNSDAPTPLFNSDNLVTAVSSVVFNSDAQLLATCSPVKENQIRLVHVQSQTTFKNFPQRHEKVSKAKCLDISPKGGYLAVGNEDGKLHIFRIHHFSDY